MTSDIYAFYYIPVQLVIGLVAGLVFRRLRPSHTAGSRSESLPPSAPWAGSCFRQRL